MCVLSNHHPYVIRDYTCLNLSIILLWSYNSPTYSESPKWVSGRIFGPEIGRIFCRNCFGINYGFRWWKEYSLFAKNSAKLPNIRLQINSYRNLKIMFRWFTKPSLVSFLACNSSLFCEWDHFKIKVSNTKTWIRPF